MLIAIAHFPGGDSFKCRLVLLFHRTRCNKSRGFAGPSGDMIVYMEHERERLDEAIEEMEFDAKKMQEHSEELADRAEKVKSDWRAKQADEAVPGAQPSRDTNE